MTKALLPQQRGNLATEDILADFGRFLRLHTADGDPSPATVRSYYGNAAQFVAWCEERGINPATVTEDDIAIYRRKTLEFEAIRLEQLQPVLPPSEDRDANPSTSTSSTLPRTTDPASASTSAPTLTNRLKPWPALRPTRS